MQGVLDKFYILIFCCYFLDWLELLTHTASLESLNLSSFIYMTTDKMDDWNPPESWKRITCIMMIHASYQNKEIMVAAQCSLNTGNNQA